MENRPSCLRMEYILAARYQRCVGRFADLRFDIFPGCYRPFLVLPRFHSPLAPLSSADALQPDSDILPSFFCRSFCLLHHLKSVDRFGQLLSHCQTNIGSLCSYPDLRDGSYLVGLLVCPIIHSIVRSFSLSLASRYVAAATQS